MKLVCASNARLCDALCSLHCMASRQSTHKVQTCFSDIQTAAAPTTIILGFINKRTECEPSQFGSNREHIAAANAASKGPCIHCFCVGFECVYLYVDWNKSVPQFLGV